MRHLKINHMTITGIDILSPQRLQVLLILAGVLLNSFRKKEKNLNK